MKILIVEDENDPPEQLLEATQCVKDINPKPTVYLVTSSKYSSALIEGLGIDGIIDTSCNAQEIMTKL